MAIRFLAWIGLVSVLTLLLLWSLFFTFLLAQLDWHILVLILIQSEFSLIYYQKPRRCYFLRYYCWWPKSILVIYIKFRGYIRGGGWQGALGTTLTNMFHWTWPVASRILPHLQVFFVLRAIQCWKRQTL